MAPMLRRFRIEGLYKTRTIDIPVQDNRLVLVGENGTGKSTVANLMYLFLSKQWHRMLNYEFAKIVATVDTEKFEIPRQDLQGPMLSEIDRHLPDIVSRQRVEAMAAQLLRAGPDVLSDPEYLSHLCRTYDAPESIIPLILLACRREPPPSSSLAKRSEILAGFDFGQVLYLPTYRRIEQDLQSIFRGLDTDIRNLRRRLRKPRDRDTFIELVEFGMEDVQETITQRMSQVKDNVRTGLSNLTGTYLRDVIRGAYQSAELSPQLTTLADPTLAAILNRIPTAVLSDEEKNSLVSMLSRIKEVGHLEQSDKVVVHFLTQLIELYVDQQRNESDVRDFVRVCNSYLVNKELQYDDEDFEIHVRQESGSSEAREIALESLSSGEKQIVSLFSHIYLSGGRGYFVIIDEPELSLSVPWQRKFLPDIVATGKCNGLVAVTHSPFVFENELDDCAYSLEQYMETADVVH